MRVVLRIVHYILCQGDLWPRHQSSALGHADLPPVTHQESPSIGEGGGEKTRPSGSESGCSCARTATGIRRVATREKDSAFMRSAQDFTLVVQIDSSKPLASLWQAPSQLTSELVLRTGPIIL